MKETTSKEEGKTNPMSEMADTAMKNYEQTIRTSLKMQEEAGRWWNSMLNQAACAQSWQKRFGNVTSVAEGLLPLAQERVEEFVGIVGKNSRVGAGLMKQAIDAAQTPAFAESQTKWMEFWTSSIGAARTGAGAMAQMGSKAMDSWFDFIQKNTDAAELRVPKAA